MRFAIPVFLLLLLPALALAHGLEMEARIIDEQVRIEAFFDDDSPASNAKITIEDSTKTMLKEGMTDDRGFWTIPKPKPGKYTVRVDAGDGHAAKTTITIPDDGETAASEGTNREFLTGWNRVIMTGVGLALIAGLTLVMRVTRRRA